MAVSLGTQIQSYELTSLLGKGGMDEVYRARDTKLKREVAIKIQFRGGANPSLTSDFPISKQDFWIE